MDTTKQEQIDAIAEEVANLTESPLYELRVENDYKPVIGEGSLDAKIMFIGEAPGEREAKSGRPFVGASGRLLNEMLASVGIDRDEVYISNVVKDRPPKNRNPHKKEIRLYAPFLVRQVNIIQPQVLVPLGKFAMEFTLEQFNSPAAEGGKISQLHGQKLSGTAEYGEVAIVPLFHPAVALYADERRPALFEDFRALSEFV